MWNNMVVFSHLKGISNVADSTFLILFLIVHLRTGSINANWMHGSRHLKYMTHPVWEDDNYYYYTLLLMCCQILHFYELFLWIYCISDSIYGIANSYRDRCSLSRNFVNFFSNNIIVLTLKRPKQCRIFWNCQ